MHPYNADGALSVQRSFYETIPYDMANHQAMVQSDGCFSISRFSVVNFGEILRERSFYGPLTIGNHSIGATDTKTVEMIGRSQHTRLKVDAFDVCHEVFLDESSTAVYSQFTIQSRSEEPAPFSYDFGFLFSKSHTDRDIQYLATKAVPQDGMWHNHLSDQHTLTIDCSAELTLREVQDVGVHYTASATIAPLGTTTIRFVYAFHEGNDTPKTLKDFDSAKDESDAYIQSLLDFATPYTGRDKALFVSCLNCGLSSYRETADFKGFFAGIHYQTPLRTYFRDGYFTAISVLSFRPELVRNELLTLALGIDSDGKCPSAVIDANHVYWPDHLDSPMFFVILLYDYIEATGDATILDETCGDKTLAKHAMTILDALISQLDGNGLLTRERGNRHDWVDNVYREGYVTYIEALAYRALICGSQLFPQSERHYASEAQRVKDGINEHLWLSDKGWYANYISDDAREENLSIDTILTVLFGVAPPDRAQSILGAMEHWLESKHNDEQPFGDWGVLCCYPPYGYKTHLVEKSSYDYCYHNGSDWPYWSCMYAYAKSLYGMDYTYPLTRWFTYGLDHDCYTPLEYICQVAPSGSLLQAWSATGAYALHHIHKDNEGGSSCSTRN